jgi:hypothetical protein
MSKGVTSGRQAEGADSVAGGAMLVPVADLGGTTWCMWTVLLVLHTSRQRAVYTFVLGWYRVSRAATPYHPEADMSPVLYAI